MKKYLFVCGIVLLSGCSSMGSMFGSSGSGSSGQGNISGMSGVTGYSAATGNPISTEAFIYAGGN